jgi:hypothetical protein
MSLFVTAFALYHAAVAAGPDVATVSKTAVRLSAAAVPATTSTAAPPAATIPPAAPIPSATNTGPRIANPQNVGDVVVEANRSLTLTDVVADSILVWGGGQLTATNIRVTGSLVVFPRVNGNLTKLSLTNSAVHDGLTINTTDSQGNLYWGSEVPVNVLVSGAWINRSQGSGSDHTEALAGFGWPRGARFENTTFVQVGPFNGTATAVINWHGADSVFTGCNFIWSNGKAAYYTLYVEGRNNLVTNSRLDKGLSSYVYPSSSPKATYTSNRDASTGAIIAG